MRHHEEFTAPTTKTHLAVPWFARQITRGEYRGPFGQKSI